MAIASRHLHTGFTVDDLLAMPEDGQKYELFDGMLIVNPPPIVVHQFAMARLMYLLQPPAGSRWFTLSSPIGWRPAQAQRWFEPDVVVVDLPHGPAGLAYLTEPPALVVEVLSPSTRSYDQTLKRQAYEEGGVGAYWIVDPSSVEPSMVVLERSSSGAAFGEVSRGTGSEVVYATHPWSVEIVPADLVR